MLKLRAAVHEQTHNYAAALTDRQLLLQLNPNPIAGFNVAQALHALGWWFALRSPALHVAFMMRAVIQ